MTETTREIKPFEEGWGELSMDDRMRIWLGKQRDLSRTARKTIENFVIGCPDAGYKDYLNFRYINIKDFSDGTQGKLLDGFFAIYNTSEDLLKWRYCNSRARKDVNPELN